MVLVSSKCKSSTLIMGGLSIHEQQAVIRVGAQRISDPCEGNRRLILETRHDAEVPMALLVKFASEANRVGRSASFCHLLDHASRGRG